MSTAESRRFSIDQAVKITSKPNFLGQMHMPEIIVFTANDVIEIAKHIDKYINTGA